MIKVICDTNFLIHLSTTRIFNFNNLNSEIGELEFLVPNVVLNELTKLESNPAKKNSILATKKFIEKFKNIEINGNFADEEIVNYLKLKKCFVATMDKKLKQQVKNLGCSIISFHKDRIILEN